MKFRKLGRTDIDVSEICLGTMTWGKQNTEEEAIEQLDYGVSQGINFIDTAEMYAVPPTEETYTLTEQYIGRWLAKRGKHDDLVIATKVAGRSKDLSYTRPGDQFPDLTPEQINYAVDGSLKRLQIDCIDLYQLHWPSRPVNIFGERFFPLRSPKEGGVPLLETLQAMTDLVKAGKIRYIGLSNESPWGTMEYLRLAEQHDLERVVSVQNAYSLLNRVYDNGMSEVSLREDVGLLAYSPLASGLLSGKYQDGARPEGARLTLFGERFWGRANVEDAERCVAEYVKLASDNGMDPNQLAIAFTLYGNFITSSIIGATTMEQLKTNIAAVDVDLSDGLMEEILAIGERYRSPVC